MGQEWSVNPKLEATNLGTYALTKDQPFNAMFAPEAEDNYR
jgi:hypothetical protein